MKSYKITHISEITKDAHDTIIKAETKAKAIKAFKGQYYNPPTIIAVEKIDNK